MIRLHYPASQEAYNHYLSKLFFAFSRNFSNDLNDNLIHHRNKPVLMIKNVRRFQSAIMPDTVSKDGKSYTIPDKWK